MVAENLPSGGDLSPHVESVHRSSPFRSTLNTGYIKGLDMGKVSLATQNIPGEVVK